MTPSGAEQRVLRLPAMRSVLVAFGLPDGFARGEVEEVADRIRNVYRPLLGDEAGIATRIHPHASAAVVAVGPGLEGTLPDCVVWGLAVEAHGGATPAQLTQVIGDPTTARHLSGLFVVVGFTPAAIRLVSTSTLMHTLKLVRGPQAVAVATRGYAAHLAAGVSPRIDEERIGELITLDYVLNDAELLQGSRVLEEASVVEFSRAECEDWRWSPRTDRVGAAQVPSTATELIAVLGDQTEQIVGVNGATLGLTAGVDSTLVAACAHDRGLAMSSFTMGWQGLPDADGGAAVARQIGWPHTLVGARRYDDGDPADASSLPPAAELFAVLVQWARWTEGLDHPRNAVAGRLDWPIRGATWVSGHGGETGRAFYWKYAEPPLDVQRLMFGEFMTGMSATAVDQARSHLADEVAGASHLGVTDPADQLDFVYAYGRMRKWLARGLPLPQVDNVYPAFLAPAVLSSLLHGPVEARRDGSLFRDAHARFDPNLHRLARTAARGRLPRRAIRKLTRELRGPQPPWDQPMLDRLVAYVTDKGPGVVVGSLGAEWWAKTIERAPTSPRHNLFLWNAIGVEAAAVAFDGGG